MKTELALKYTARKLNESTGQDKEYFIKVREVLLKRTAKKPDLLFGVFICPTCDNPCHDSDNFCRGCGQKLLWER